MIIKNIIMLFKIMFFWAIIFSLVILNVTLLPNVESEKVRFSMALMIFILSLSFIIIPFYFIFLDEIKKKFAKDEVGE